MRDVPALEQSAVGAVFFLRHWFPRSQSLLRQKERLRRRIVERVRQGGPGRIIAVDRRRDLSATEFRSQYLRRGLPVVLEGAGLDWGCSRNWSFDSLLERFGHNTIKLVQRKGVAVDDEVADGREFSEEILFADFLAQVLGGGGKYMRFSPLLEQFPELLDDINHDFVERMPGINLGTTYQMFIGGAGTYTPLHNAITPFFFINVCGEKRWQFIPGTYLSVLDPSPDGLTYNYTSADLAMTNLDRYPGFDCIDRMEAEMHPGDVLFNPSWMWHCARNASPTIGLRCGFIEPMSMLREALTLTLVRAFAGNPSMIKTAWYSFFNTNLSEREELLLTPKVFSRQPPGAGQRRHG